jgi:hypothetical protein
MLRIYLPLFLLVGSFTASFSQNFGGKQIGLGIGFSHQAIKSELISPYTHQGNSAPLQLYFRSGKEVSRHHIQLQYFSADLTSASNGLSTTDEKGYIQYAYHRRLTIVKDKLHVFGGIVVNAQASMRNNLFNGSTGNNAAGELIGSLNPSLLAEFPVKKNVLSVQVWAPIFAFLYQQTYGLGPENGNWSSLNNFAGVDWRISYDKYLSERWNLRFDYQFQFYRLSKFETLSSLSNQGIVSLVYKIKK